MPYYGSAGTRLDLQYGKPGVRVYHLPEPKVERVEIVTPVTPVVLGKLTYIKVKLPSNFGKVKIIYDFGDGQPPIVTCRTTLGYRYSNPGVFLLKVLVPITQLCNHSRTKPTKSSKGDFGISFIFYTVLH